MGVDVDSVIFVGKHTNDPEEYFTEEQLEGFDGDWQEHGMDNPLQVHPVSDYSDRGYYVGFEMSGTNPAVVAKQIAQAAQDFKDLTGQEAEFHHWAYYW